MRRVCREVLTKTPKFGFPRRTMASSSHDASDYEPASPFDVDMGGSQRLELHQKLRSANLSLQATREERHVMERQVLYLQRKGKEKQRLLLIERHQRRALQPAFCAWARLLAAGRAIRQQRHSSAALEHEAKEKAEQAAALAERVNRVKANAQSKLAELSEANEKLVAALRERNAELRDLKQRASGGELDAARHRVSLAETAVHDLENLLESERAGRLAERAAEQRNKSALHAELRVMLRALSAADGELNALSQKEASHATVVRRLEARLDGALAEVECLKAEAKAAANLGYKASFDPPLLATGPTYEAATKGLGKDEVTAKLPLLTVELVEMASCRKALLSSTFWGWYDRLAFVKELKAQRLKVEAECGVAELEAKVKASQLEASRLERAVGQAEAAAEAAAAEAARRNDELKACRKEMATEAEVASEAAAAHVAEKAMLTAQLASVSSELVLETERAKRLEEEIERGEEVLIEIARSHRKSIGSGSPRGK